MIISIPVQFNHQKLIIIKYFYHLVDWFKVKCPFHIELTSCESFQFDDYGNNNACSRSKGVSKPVLNIYVMPIIIRKYFLLTFSIYVL